MKKKIGYYMEKIVKEYDFPGKFNLSIKLTPEFEKIYNEVYSKHPQHEKYRKIINTKRNSRSKLTNCMIVIGIILFLISLIFTYFVSDEIAEVLICASFIIPGIIIIHNKNKEYTDEKDVEKYLQYYKNSFLPDMVSHINSNLIYENINNIQMFEKYKEADFEYKNLGCEWIEDYIHGNVYDGNYIEIVNLSAYSHIDAHSIFRCFRGIFATTELNKNINSCIKIMLNRALISEGDKKINLDSTKFEEYFDVYTDNDILTMRILTADIMEMLVDFFKKYQIRFEVYLKNSKLYFRFFIGDCFEPTIYKEHEKYKLYKDYSILKLCTDLSEKFIELIDNMEI